VTPVHRAGPVHNYMQLCTAAVAEMIWAGSGDADARAAYLVRQ